MSNQDQKKIQQLPTNDKDTNNNIIVQQTIVEQFYNIDDYDETRIDHNVNIIYDEEDEDDEEEEEDNGSDLEDFIEHDEQEEVLSQDTEYNDENLSDFIEEQISITNLVTDTEDDNDVNNILEEEPKDIVDVVSDISNDSNVIKILPTGDVLKKKPDLNEISLGNIIENKKRTRKQTIFYKHPLMDTLLWNGISKDEYNVIMNNNDDYYNEPLDLKKDDQISVESISDDDDDNDSKYSSKKKFKRLKKLTNKNDNNDDDDHDHDEKKQSELDDIINFVKNNNV